MKKRKHKKKMTIIFLVAFSFLFLFMATAYSLLNETLTIEGKATITKQEASGGDFVEGVIDEDDGLVENEDGSSNFVGDAGATVNNYIQIPGDSYLWRILSIDVDGNLKIIRNRDDSLTTTFMASKNEAYNWASSLVLQNLQTWYQNNLSSLSDYIIQNPEWLLTEASKSSGPTNVTVISSFNASAIGFIRNDEVLNSSTGGVANNGNVSSWLNDGYQWTMTAVGGNSKQAWRMNGDKFMNSGVSTNSVYRPVIYLKSSTKFLGGTGTEKDPFIVS